MPPRASRAKAKAAEADKENAEQAIDVAKVAPPQPETAPKAAVKAKAAASKKPTPTVSLADELEAMTKKMNMISLEKEKAELLLKERDAQLQQKSAEESRLQGLLEKKEQEQKMLAEKVRKLQKIKEFVPSMVSISKKDIALKVLTLPVLRVCLHLADSRAIITYCTVC
jgi:hypothetical protein